MRILIVEDDDRIAKPLAEFLKRQHHIVDITTDGLAAWEWSQSALYELILLDLMLPKLDGISLCKRLRAASSNVLILMLTARDTTGDKIIDNGKLVGYVRVSQSLEEFDETLQQLDLGLGGGIIITLVLSSIGGIFLTRQAMQPIEESFQRLKQFTADASHELRSPLMAIKINAELPLEYPEEIGPKDAEKFQAIANATNQMTRLTEDLLLLARSDRASHQNRETLNLTSILENLIQQYKPQAEAKKINLKIQLIANLQLIGDSVQLTRLFTNLVENALHYTPSGGVVEIKSSRVGSQLYVNVQDTGVGIAPEHIDKAFERFWRADQSRSYWSGGSGLGLAIAQAIAQNHGGLISVTSQLGVGSCFTVRLPTS